MLTVLKLALAGALLPIPIGAGLRYHPPPGAHGRCAPGALATGRRVHLELFANRRVIIIPAGVGLRGARLEYGRAVAARCRTSIWTTDPTGVVRFTGTPRLGDIFHVWGQALTAGRLLSFRGTVRLYRTGLRVARDPRRLALRDGDQIVIEVGPYVAPHRSYRFPS